MILIELYIYIYNLSDNLESEIKAFQNHVRVLRLELNFTFPFIYDCKNCINPFLVRSRYIKIII